MFRDPTGWLLGFAAASLLLPPLPLPFGESGPHVAVLFAGLGLWRGIALWRQWRIPLDLLTGSAVALALTMALSVVTALIGLGPSLALGSLSRVILFGISLYALFYFGYGPARGTPRESLRWARWLYFLGIGSALFACVDFYFQWSPPAGFGEQWVWLPGGIYRRAQGLFYEAGVIGNLCSFFLVLTAVAWLRPEVGRQVLSRKLLVVGGIVFSAALLFSFSRGALLNVLASMAAVFVLFRSRAEFQRVLPMILTVLAGGLLLTYILFPAFVETYLLRLVYSLLDLGEKPDTVLGGRVTIWSTILSALSADPVKLFFGVGFKTLPYGGLDGESLIADNMYISMLAETGIIGLLAMLAFSGAVLRYSYRAACHPSEAPSLLGAWIFCFWIGQLCQMLSVDALTYWRVLPLYLGVLGLAVQQLRVSDAHRQS